MPDFDREKWNRKFRNAAQDWSTPSRVAQRLEPFLPNAGSALDVAGGVGRHAIWLAKRGLDVTLADISTVGIAHAQESAQAHGQSLKTIETDLEETAFPAGPWDVIFSHHFLYRPLFAEFATALPPGGRLIVIQPTVTNLERNAKPPRDFLLNDAELPSLVPTLEIIHYEEDWNEEGRHEAVMVAEKS